MKRTLPDALEPAHKRLERQFSHLSLRRRLSRRSSPGAEVVPQGAAARAPDQADGDTDVDGADAAAGADADVGARDGAPPTIHIDPAYLRVPDAVLQAGAAPAIVSEVRAPPGSSSATPPPQALILYQPADPVQQGLREAREAAEKAATVPDAIDDDDMADAADESQDFALAASPVMDID